MYKIFMRLGQKILGIGEFKNLKIKVNVLFFLLPITHIREIVKAVKKAVGIFPNIQGSLVSIRATFLSKSKFCETSMKDGKYTIRLNLLYWCFPLLKSILKKEFNANVFSTSDIEGLVLHEMAYVISGLIIAEFLDGDFYDDWKQGLTVSLLLEDAGFKQEDFSSISSASTKGFDEAFAEILSASMNGEIHLSKIPIDIQHKADTLFDDVRKIW